MFLFTGETMRNSKTDDIKPKWNYLQAEVDGVLQLIRNI